MIKLTRGTVSYILCSKKNLQCPNRHYMKPLGSLDVERRAEWTHLIQCFSRELTDRKYSVLGYDFMELLVNLTTGFGDRETCRNEYIS